MQLSCVSQLHQHSSSEKLGERRDPINGLWGRNNPLFDVSKTKALGSEYFLIIYHRKGESRKVSGFSLRFKECVEERESSLQFSYPPINNHPNELLRFVVSRYSTTLPSSSFFLPTISLRSLYPPF